MNWVAFVDTIRIALRSRARLGLIAPTQTGAGIAQAPAKSGQTTAKRRPRVVVMQLQPLWEFKPLGMDCCLLSMTAGKCTCLGI